MRPQWKSVHYLGNKPRPQANFARARQPILSTVDRLFLEADQKWILTWTALITVTTQPL